jgi:uncharacterized membrane protein
VADPRDVERLAALTDGVVAIAITLLVLDIRLRPDAGDLSDPDMLQVLLALWPKYFGYVLSFLVIGNFWIVHTRRFRALKTADGSLMWLNLLFLLAIGFVPFVTSVLSENDGGVATILYAATMTLASISLSLMWWYASRHDLFESADSARGHFLRSASTAAIFLASIAVAVFNADYARYVWLLLIPASFGWRLRA